MFHVKEYHTCLCFALCFPSVGGGSDHRHTATEDAITRVEVINDGITTPSRQKPARECHSSPNNKLKYIQAGYILSRHSLAGGA